MNLTLRYFASMKELMQCESEILDLAEPIATVGELKNYLQTSNPRFAESVSEVGRLRVAVNLDMADDETPLVDKAEVAFFPPVTGG